MLAGHLFCKRYESLLCLNVMSLYCIPAGSIGDKAYLSLATQIEYVFFGLAHCRVFPLILQDYIIWPQPEVLGLLLGLCRTLGDWDAAARLLQSLGGGFEIFVQIDILVYVCQQDTDI